jgi:2-hydroxychromene-2-carboxylate isomerase
VRRVETKERERVELDEPAQFEIFFDYGCPYVYAVDEWLRQVAEQRGEPIRVRWRYFPLEQVNATDRPDWKLWEAEWPRPKAQVAFHGAIAARRQGEDAFLRFHRALLRAKHLEGQEHGRPAVVREVAATVGLDMERFDRDVADRTLLAAIGEDYEEARTRHGVFGTPTFVFPNGSAIYIKLRKDELPADPLSFYGEFLNIAQDRPNVLELKRPVKPVAA